MFDEHPTRFEWMRLAMSELDQTRSAVLRDHAASCAQCGAELKALLDTQAAGAENAPAFVPPARVLPLRPLGALALAASVAAAVILIPRETVRGKGEAAISILCQAPAQERPSSCRSGDQVRPGTAIAFRARLEQDTHLMIVGRDDRHEWKTYFPKEGERSVLVSKTVSDFMAASLVLDAVGSRETFVVFSSPKPFDRRAIENHLRGEPENEIDAARFELLKTEKE